jgi:hypothetical protein
MRTVNRPSGCRMGSNLGPVGGGGVWQLLKEQPVPVRMMSEVEQVPTENWAPGQALQVWAARGPVWSRGKARSAAREPRQSRPGPEVPRATGGRLRLPGHAGILPYV